MIKIDASGPDTHGVDIQGKPKDLTLEFSMITSSLMASFVERGHSVQDVKEGLMVAFMSGISLYKEALHSEVKGGVSE